MSFNDPWAEMALGNSLSDSFIFGDGGDGSPDDTGPAADAGWAGASSGPVVGLDWVAGAAIQLSGSSGGALNLGAMASQAAASVAQVLPIDATGYAKPDNKGGGGGGGGKGGGKPGPDPDPTPGTLDTYTSGGAADTSFNITIEFSGTWTSALQQAFVDVADFLSSVILADVTDITRGRYATDDITISASLTDIDGSGGILGQAGPTAYRAASYIPVAGVMEFDTADAEDYAALGLWEEIVFHEMMHCLGFGTLFEAVGLTSGSIAGGDLVFTGVNATYEYGLLGGTGYVPLETDGGAGTAGGHWDEGNLILGATEIMTGYINSSNYLSQVTIAALEDFGYDTVYDDITSSSDLTGAMPDPGFIFA